MVCKHTFWELADERAVRRPRCSSDFSVSYSDTGSIDTVSIAASEHSTEVDSDSQISLSGSEAFAPTVAESGPPGLHCWPVAPQCVLVPVLPPVAPAPAAVKRSKKLEQSQHDADLVQDGTLTSVMLKNLPNNMNRADLLALFDLLGFKGEYDFLYLPIDFARQSNLGYCFVNLVTADAASRFYATFSGFSSWRGSSEKVCQARWSQPYQGLACHIERYRDSPVMHEALPDECRPVLFHGGVRVAFPAPTKPLRRPRMRMPPAKSPYWQKSTASV